MLSRWRRPRISSRSRHSRRRLETQRSACARARGARTGALITRMPSARKTWSKSRVNLLSRSRIRNRGCTPSSSSRINRLRAAQPAAPARTAGGAGRGPRSPSRVPSASAAQTAPAAAAAPSRETTTPRPENDPPRPLTLQTQHTPPPQRASPSSRQAISVSGTHRLPFDREQRDAFDAVLLGGVVCALGDEAVLLVLFEVVELEAGGFDCFAVVVALHGAADAGGPERGVAGDTFGELGGGDDVCDCEPAAHAENARCFGEDLCLVGGEVDDPVRDDDVGGAAVERELLDVRIAELHVCVAVLGCEVRRLGELGLGHIDPDHPSVAARLTGGEEAVGAGAAAEVDDRLTGLDCGEVEVVADAGEGVDRGRRDCVELVAGVAESLGELPAGLEVKLVERLLGDLAVHVLDALLELLGVERSLCCAHLSLLRRWSSALYCLLPKYSSDSLRTWVELRRAPCSMRSPRWRRRSAVAAAPRSWTCSPRASARSRRSRPRSTRASPTPPTTCSCSCMPAWCARVARARGFTTGSRAIGSATCGRLCARWPSGTSPKCTFWPTTTWANAAASSRSPRTSSRRGLTRGASLFLTFVPSRSTAPVTSVARCRRRSTRSTRSQRSCRNGARSSPTAADPTASMPTTPSGCCRSAG